MTDRTFVVAIDARYRRAQASIFREALKGNPAITAWWNHIPYVYLVTSRLDADSLSANLFERSKLDSFFVMEVNPSESEGLLSDEAWKWIMKRSATRATEHAD